MEKHILFFDIDNTVYYHGWFPFRVQFAIRRAQKAGHYVVLNTGRSKYGIPKSLLRRIKWDGLICSGSYVEFHGEVLHNELMPEQNVRKILEFLDEEKKDLPVVFDCDGQCYSINFNRPIKLRKIEDLFVDFEKKRVNKLEVLYPLSQETMDKIAPYASCYSMGTYVDIFVKGVSKATGMRLIGEKTGLPKERMIAFGDNNNDLDMLRYAGKSVAMEQASEGAVQASTYHATKYRAGVIQGIKKYLGV